MTSSKISAGLVMYRMTRGCLEVFLSHPGGPFFARKDDGYWTIPKGEVEPGEELLSAAQREFQEEIGLRPEGEFLPLGNIRQKGGKRVHAWAFPGDWDDSRSIRSNSFPLEWPPLSGKIQYFPEMDRAQFFALPEARRKLKPTQHPFLDRLTEHLGLTAEGKKPSSPSGSRSSPAS